MNSRSSRWVSAIGAVLVGGGLVMASYGSGVTPAAAALPANNPGNPFQAILDKLEQVLAAITGGAGAGNHTLRWDTNNPSASRFTTAFTGAVLDQNTGLVWEQAPDATTRLWATATIYCVNKTVGGTRGWRLPSVVELASLIDPSLPAPFVPASAFTIGGSPGVQSGTYWSATTPAVPPIDAWIVLFDNGVVTHVDKTRSTYAWCVRGGMNAEAY